MKHKTPILFVGHGSPMNAIENNIFTQNFRQVAKEMEIPKAIICISAHWVTEGTKITAMANPKTIHDFYGFPKELYEIEYRALGSLELAKKVKELLADESISLDHSWGLDHGTWSILCHMYPKADIPVIQISLDYRKPALDHFNFAKKLSSLRSEGVLIIGSGNIIHNLSLIDFKNIETVGHGFTWAKRVQDLMNENILKNNFQFLVNYDKQDSDFKLAIPTPEHFLPLIYILGLKEDDEKIKLWNDVLVGGSLSMTSLQIS